MKKNILLLSLLFTASFGQELLATSPAAVSVSCEEYPCVSSLELNACFEGHDPLNCEEPGCTACDFLFNLSHSTFVNVINSLNAAEPQNIDQGKPPKRPKRKNSEIYASSTKASAHLELPTKKWQRKKCIHGKRKDNCKECGGSAFCTHGKRKTYCKECGGSAFCTHGNWKSICKECGGSAFCTHGKQKNYCKACGGSALCTHGKRKSRCKTCKVPCPHAEKRYKCKEGCYESLAQRRVREAAIASSATI